MTEAGEAARAASAAWLASVPVALRADLGHRGVADYGFGAGPSCMAGKTWKGPRSLEDAVATLVTFRHSLRAAHIRFDDGTCLWFTHDGFLRVEVRGAPPEPGATVRHRND